MLLGNLNEGTGTAVGWAAVGLGTLRQRRGFMPNPEHGAARGAGPGARQGRRTEGRDERRCFSGGAVAAESFWARRRGESGRKW